jgi:hypothetical protein
MKKSEIRNVFSMASSKGWEHVNKFIETNLNANRKELENNNFKSLEDVRELQGRIKSLEKVKKFVETRVDKYTKNN